MIHLALWLASFLFLLWFTLRFVLPVLVWAVSGLRRFVNHYRTEVGAVFAVAWVGAVIYMLSRILARRH